MYIKKSSGNGRCLNCGKEFVIKNTKHKYCSNKCLRNYEEKKRGRKFIKISCIVCGEVFTKKNKHHNTVTTK